MPRAKRPATTVSGWGSEHELATDRDSAMTPQAFRWSLFAANAALTVASLDHGFIYLAAFSAFITGCGLVNALLTEPAP